MADAAGAPGETDLAVMLESLAVVRRPGVFTYVDVEAPTPGVLALAHAIVTEAESTTLVLPVDAAHEAGLPSIVEFAWLTITVQSSLEAVGLTAAFSAMLAERGIACNVLAGYHHDHVLVPVDRADDAIAALSRGGDR